MILRTVAEIWSKVEESRWRSDAKQAAAPEGPNRRTQEAAQILDELGCNPIRGMTEIALNDARPVDLRARMFLEPAH